MASIYQLNYLTECAKVSDNVTVDQVPVDS